MTERRPALHRWLFTICCLSLFHWATGAHAVTLDNGTIRLRLGLDAQATPVIEEAAWVGSSQPEKHVLRFRRERIRPE